MLTELNLKQEYRTKESPPINFYINCLEQCVRFDRSAGYFTSAGISRASQGFSSFIKKGGKIRLIVSPSFGEDDIAAIVKGIRTRNDVIESTMLRTIETIKFGVEKDRFKTLCWLVAKKYIDIKIAIRVNSHGVPQRGIYHEKMGVFYDEDDNMVAFSGSSNETQGGWVDNFESIDVYTSWNQINDKKRVEKKKNNFNKLWNNTTEFLEVFNIPQAINNGLIRKAPKVFPQNVDIFEVKDPNRIDLNILDYPIEPKYPDWLTTLRPYQSKMIQLWDNYERNGIFEMATGTGKTITALAAATNLFHNIKKLFVIVCCPNSPLVNQWVKEATDFGFLPVKAAGSYQTWHRKIRGLKIEFEQNLISCGMVITNNQTLFDRNKKLMRYIEDLKDLPILFIADEVHNLGSNNIRKMLPKYFRYKIGLTATPKRYFDEVGTDALFEYFGQPLPINPAVDLKFAIENKYLSPYRYIPKIVFLDDDETHRYHKITKEINRMRHYRDNDDESLKKKYRDRTAIINNASNKLHAFDKLLKDIGKQSQSLFFVTEKQIDSVSDILINKHGYMIYRITSRFRKQYSEIIKNFTTGMVDALIAIKVIDEGLDVPSTKNGFFLASTGNPKQFIQRRGRVLRKSENKTHANIYDFIVIPNGNIESGTNIVKKALTNELRRFMEFATLALNFEEAKSVILKIALDNGIYNLGE